MCNMSNVLFLVGRFDYSDSDDYENKILSSNAGMASRQALHDPQDDRIFSFTVPKSVGKCQAC